jgi:NAD(P)-dependent dehydrogenase (short-subunit alcohol dehydrogenase family)
MSELRTLLITGASSGLGRAFAEAALDAGHRVIGTVRSEHAASAFSSLAPDRTCAVTLDVTDFEAVSAGVRDAESAFGPIDVLVNNAGYGQEGVLEETPLEDIRRQFDANVFGAVAMMKAVLPGMRVRRSGHIVNVTSMGGFITMPGITAYCGSKFALEGISEALAGEVKALGIRVTALAPGQFRTDWAGRSMDRAPRTIGDYDAVMDPIRAARQAKSGHQPGDPARAARALLKLISLENPPVRWYLGADAIALVEKKLELMKAEMAAWDELSRSTDFGSPPLLQSR